MLKRLRYECIITPNYNNWIEIQELGNVNSKP